MDGEHKNAPRAESRSLPSHHGKLRVFVSYSRKDDAFAQELVTGLDVVGFQPYLDKHDIAAGEDWEARLSRLIEAADTVVFIISPDAVASDRCAWEVKRTAELQKRLLPIVWRVVPEAEVPPRLKQLNYIFFDKPHSFAPSLAALTKALRTDLGWIREHTRLGEMALRWQDRARSGALLLRGEELHAAKDWLKAQPRYAPEPPLLTHEFIKASEDAEDARVSAQRKQLDEVAAAQARTARLQRRAYLLLVGLIIGIVGWTNESYLAERWRWWAVMRPYMVSQVRPYVLNAAREQALEAGDVFRECARDCPEMVVVPAGRFLMGSGVDDPMQRPNEGPPHQVILARPFAVSRFQVTFADWEACATVGGCPATGDAGFGRGERPVIYVSWDDAKQYVAWLSRMTGKSYRLLTEAEYEYAARAGLATPYPWGDVLGINQANCNGCGSAWDNQRTAPVGSFQPNAFKLYDMVGNVFQWIEDCYHNDYFGAPTDGSAWTTGDCGRRVVRGGSWSSDPRVLRSASRARGSTVNRDDNVGFRVRRTISGVNSE
jgi:formylglycine-generating enzyme required for sulfatase activity